MEQSAASGHRGTSSFHGDVCAGYGYILYRTELSGPVVVRLVVDDLRDYAAVYLNQKFQGTMDRRLKQTQL
jgi:beta-galactosidase